MSSCHCNFSLQSKLIRHVRKNISMYRLASCAAVAAAGPKVLGLSWYTAFAGSIAMYLLTGGWKWLRLAYKTFGRDFFFGRIILGVELGIRKIVRNKQMLGDVFAEKALQHPDKVVFISAETGETLTYKQANDLANKIANIFYEAGYRKGDVVALIMENRIEYIPIWLGLSKLGVITSLINYNLRGESLKHCVTVCDCKSIIFSDELQGAVEEIAPDLKVDFYYFGNESSSINNVTYLKTLIEKASTVQPPKPEDLSLSDKMLLIYTSGTTGFPKAAVIRGSRYCFMAMGVGKGLGVTADDIAYNSLPLYHSNGGIALSGGVFFFGHTVVIRKKFSASRFFEDCTKYNVTVINYIGETCRYLLAQPKGPFDQAHKVRAATGNGLRKSIWEEFQKRFNIGLIGEFYGATEGNANMMNSVGRVGAVGFNSVLIPWVYPIKIVRVDEEGNIMRGADGLASEAQPGEVGELVGKVRNDNSLRQFDGYLNKSATQKKIAYDIFKKGDSAFMTGDRLIQDEEGFYYFQDRTGDTFRWKGENVSTNEVENVINKAVDNEICVYGVEVPGVEGKAGMACIVDVEKKVDLSHLPEVLGKSLPPYARPVFVRLASDIPKTSTFKFKKNILRDEGYNPASCAAGDLLFYFDGKEKKFLSIDADVYAKIQDQKIRL